MKLKNVLLNEWKIDPKQTLQQLGGNKFLAMTGAKNLMYDEKENYFSFKLPRAKNGINYVKITLNSNDYYDIEYATFRMSMKSEKGYTYKVKKSFDNVPAENLRDNFEQTTGLYTSL